jgi:hypothetical protein
MVALIYRLMRQEEWNRLNNTSRRVMAEPLFQASLPAPCKMTPSGPVSLTVTASRLIFVEFRTAITESLAPFP